MDNLVIVYLARPRGDSYGGYNRVDSLFASVSLSRKFGPPTAPVVIFHEDFGEGEKQRFKSLDVRFESLPDWSIHQDRFISMRPGTVAVGSYGYQMMCWFFSGIMQRHPAVRDYSHYLRLDDDAYLLEPVSADSLRRSHYTYAAVFSEYEPGSRTLWDHTAKFLVQEGIPPRNYSGNAPYNNFHAASQELWNHPLIQRYLKSIEAVDGFMRHGWTDAAIHSHIIWGLCPAAGLKTESIPVKYRHNQHCLNHEEHTQYCYDKNHSRLTGGPPVID